MPAPDESAVSDLINGLRPGVDLDDTSLETRQMIEHWLMRETWQIADEALPLIVGVAPRQWAEFVNANGLATAATQAVAALRDDPGATGNDALDPGAVQHWARRHHVRLPAALDEVLGFIARVLPSTPAAPGAADAAGVAAERELVLGAALALVTRFPAQCRDPQGFFDGAAIADLMLQQAARWFPLAPPTLGRDDIAKLLETYLT